jgi:hypothetical protein
VDQNGKERIRNFGHVAGSGELDARPAHLRLLRGFGARPGIEERELGHALCRLAHDLERDVAAHGQPSEREARRRRGQDSPRDRGNGVVAGVVGHEDRTEAP